MRRGLLPQWVMEERRGPLLDDTLMIWRWRLFVGIFWTQIQAMVQRDLASLLYCPLLSKIFLQGWALPWLGSAASSVGLGPKACDSGPGAAKWMPLVATEKRGDGGSCLYSEKRSGKAMDGLYYY